MHVRVVGKAQDVGDLVGYLEVGGSSRDHAGGNPRLVARAPMGDRLGSFDEVDGDVVGHQVLAVREELPLLGRGGQVTLPGRGGGARSHLEDAAGQDIGGQGGE